MACPITTGFTLGCKDNFSGIEWLAIASFDGSTVFTLGVGASASEIQSFSPTSSFYKYEQFVEQGSVTQEMSGGENSTLSFTQTITLMMETMDIATRDKALTLLQARVRVIVKTNRGDYLLFGKGGGLRSSAATAGPGKMTSDLNGFSITLTGIEKEPAAFIKESFATTLIV